MYVRKPFLYALGVDTRFLFRLPLMLEGIGAGMALYVPGRDSEAMGYDHRGTERN